MKKSAESKIKKILKELMRKRKYGIYIGFAEDHPIGYIFLKIEDGIPIYSIDKFGYISGIYINKKYRRQGYAIQLLNFGEEWLRNKGLKRIELKVDINNAAGLDFWTSQKYQKRQYVMFKQ